MVQMQLQVKDGDNNFRVVDIIERAPRWHVGWQSVTYKGKRYQVRGGIRNPWFINLRHPLKGR